MPTVLILFGMRFYFFSNEHEPVHIHVSKGGAEARFDLVPEVKLSSSYGFKAQELALAEEVIIENREIFIEIWKAFFNKR